MNSLLQTLFLLPFFRKAVYHLPTTGMDEANSSITLALQWLFYKLQVPESSVPTRELIRSFGWDTSDMFIQHDVEELNRILFDKLDERMKSTPVEGSIQKIFGGTMVNYIECLDVDYKSRSKDTFLDLQLDVKGCRNIYESLDQYVAEDKLEGDNKYYADGYGYTDAKMGTVFEKFPPVLELHLKRFEFDFDRGINVKINSYHEFYDVLDLDVDNGKYIAPTADKSVRNRYILHSVLVHSGGGHGGHYYAFIRPEMHEEGEWFKFDDERVTKESKETAIQQQYGTDEDAMATGGTRAQGMSRVSNAYMLVYVRKGDRDVIGATVSDDDIAEHIRYKHEQEKVRARYTGWVYILVCGALNFMVWRLHAERPRADQEGEAGSEEQALVENCV
jgi:ubiquitin carboxyl-terminal hydrolase 7